jgi:hypothetical protein
LLDNEFYVFSVISAGFSTYLIQSNAKAAQLNDEGCTALTVDQSSNPLPTDCW